MHTLNFVLAACIACLAVSTAQAADRVTSGSEVAQKVRGYRQAHEKAILQELADLVALPNVADNVDDISRNADHLIRLLQRRGFIARALLAAPGTPPSVYGELRTPHAKRTLLFYAHFDGQPVNQAGWLSAPFEPVMRDGPLRESVRTVDWRSADALDPEWRLFGRSSSDDRAPILAMLAAIDALRATGTPLTANIKVIFDGEEERGSPHLRQIITVNQQLLSSDVVFFCDGPIHASRRMQVYLGARGEVGLELTVFGPLRPLHSGHYGNWAPNPAVALAHLLASMRDPDGRILIPGFYDDVLPLSDAQRAALAALPNTEGELRHELALGRIEGDERLMNSIMRPALNVRGIRAGDVGDAATNSIPMQAQASIDLRLVPAQSPRRVRETVERFLKEQGWFVVEGEPDAATRLRHGKLLRAQWTLVYAPTRSDPEDPMVKSATAAIEQALGHSILTVPMMGGSVPMDLFAELLRVPVIGVPIVNHDNNQHGANENVRLQNLWDGIEVYAGLMTGMARSKGAAATSRN